MLSGFNITVLEKLVNYLSQLIVTVILARLIDVVAFGVIAICLIVFSFAQVLTGLGLGLGPVSVHDKNYKAI